MIDKILCTQTPLWRLQSEALKTQAQTYLNARGTVTAYTVQFLDGKPDMEVVYAHETGNASFDWGGEYRMIVADSIPAALRIYFGPQLCIK